MDSLIQNHIRELVDVSEGAKFIICKWIFKRKMQPIDIIEKYKMRLVGKVFSQKKGIDFFDIYATVCKITTISVSIA